MPDWTALNEKLIKRQQTNLYRRRSVLESPQGPEIRIEGKQYLNFCSNDYLGLANHPSVIDAFRVVAKKNGVGSGASHLVIGHHTEHHLLEKELAEFLDCQRVLLFSTGYMANLGVVSTLFNRHDKIFADKLNHASLNDACLLSGAKFQRYSHNDIQVLENLLSISADSTEQNKLIISDGVFSMDGDKAQLPELVSLAKQYNAWLMIDDAHGFGVVGDGGRGCLEFYNLDFTDVPIVVGTLGKAFGTAGAFVAGDEVLIETLIQNASTYIYTTATPPAVAAATRVSLQIIKNEKSRRDHLTQLIKFFRESAIELGLNLLPSDTPIQPLIVGDAEKTLAISDGLKQKGIFISAIRPPTVPKNSSRLRITLTAGHTLDQVQLLLNDLAEVCAQYGVIQ